MIISLIERMYGLKEYMTDIDQVLSSVKSDAKGLTAAEAQRRLEEHGANKLKEEKKVPLLIRFVRQLADPMVIILLIAALMSAITSIYAQESFLDTFIILFVVIVNSILGVYQESKAEKAIEALQQMAAATSKVIRDGHIQVIKSEDIVVGDVLVLEAGDAVPADARIFESASLKAEEAALTGESVPVDKFIEKLIAANDKDVPLGDRKNMVYMGSTIVYGRGKAVVVATGMDTEMGKIADAITQAKEGQTPLQQKLSQLSKLLSFVVLGISAFVFVFNIVRTGDYSFASILDTFMLAISLAVAAIPEGLVAVVTVVLSIGVTRMSKRNAIIRKLTAVETLGCAQIICSDKTGTLTQNRMTVVDNYGADTPLLARIMTLCNDAELEKDGNVIGEPTEAALVAYGHSLELNKNELEQQFPRVGEAPFDSIRKMMSTLHKIQSGVEQYTKGAPDELLKKCTYALIDGEIIPMNAEIEQNINAANKAMANKALRVLAGAFRKFDAAPYSTKAEDLEQDLVFVGLVGMIDPVRPEVISAIEECKEAGIRPIMITGDHLDTAVAIATELGIITDASQAITGQQLSTLSDKEFDAVVDKYSVYARVQPDHKVRIVKAWQSKGKITAMTGDGVNDAPSIKNADIGIGMGITGTDVTKNVADMVLADDNFATIVYAVEEGRRIYDNIRKSIQFLLASNLSEVLAIFAATVLGFTILRPIHILWINLITDTFPALALGMEEGEADLMKRSPRSPSESVFAGGVGFGVVYQGVLVALVTLAAYFIGHFMESGVWEITNSPDGITMAFLTLSMAEIFHSYNLRSQTGSLFSLKTHNLYLFAATVASLILTTSIIYVPVLAKAFQFEHISLAEYALSIGLAFSTIPIVECVKFFQRKLHKRK